MAGGFNDQGYITISINKIAYRAHRLAILYVTGKYPEDEIDHINGDRKDNRIVNLREISRQENRKNQGTLISNTSGYSNIMWYPPLEKWHVQIQCDKIKHHIGYFVKLEDAIIARDNAKIMLGFHPNHGERDSWERSREKARTSTKD